MPERAVRDEATGRDYQSPKGHLRLTGSISFHGNRIALPGVSIVVTPPSDG